MLGVKHKTPGQRPADGRPEKQGWPVFISSPNPLHLRTRIPHGGYLVNSPRAGMQQGSTSSTGCVGSPIFIFYPLGESLRMQILCTNAGGFVILSHPEMFCGPSISQHQVVRSSRAALQTEDPEGGPSHFHDFPFNRSRAALRREDPEGVTFLNRVPHPDFGIHSGAPHRHICDVWRHQ